MRRFALLSAFAIGLAVPACGSSGTATLTSNHVVGTFTFDAPPNGTSTSPTMHVTNGTFDLTF